MRNCVSVPGLIAILAAGLSWSSRAAGEWVPMRPQSAHRQAHIKIPEPLVSVGPTRNPGTEKLNGTCTYGGDVRIGDLDGDGTVDFVLAKAVGGIKTCYLGAFTWAGKVRWEWGDKMRRAASADKAGETYAAESPVRPGSVLVIDIDGDGWTEVVAMVLRPGVTKTSWWDMKDMEFVILDGANGKVKHRAAPEPLAKAGGYDESGKRHRANYVHQRLLAADFRGLGRPGDFVVKIGNSVIACNGRLEPLWTYHNKFSKYGEHSCYIPCVGDVDGDSRDEVCGGNYLLDHDGTVRWEKMMAEHNDSVAIADWDGDAGNGLEAILSGFGQVVNASGEVLLKLGQEMVPHGQELRCGEFRPDAPGLEMAIRYRGHTPDVLIASKSGEVLARFKVDPSPVNVGLETVYWTGLNKPPLLFSPCALFGGHGRKVVTIPNLPAPSGKGRMGWFHCIPACLDTSGGESVVLYDPYADEVFVYGAKPLASDPPTGYRHTARQYNVRLMD